MNLQQILENISAALDEENIRYALIGGLAMAFRGIQRNTLDVDLILTLEDLETADRVLHKLRYSRTFLSENISHYSGETRELGRIDLLHAFRGPTLGMLARSERLREPGMTRAVPVVHLEDLIGLKLQALNNDCEREPRDWADICLMVQTARDRKELLDWELLGDYFELFDAASRLLQLKKVYDGTIV